MKRFLSILVAAFLLAGCRIELPPVEAGFVANGYATVDSPNKNALSPAQLEALAEWFAQRRDGWQFRIVDFAPDTSLLLKHQHEKITWVYLSGNQLWVRDRVKLLTDDERLELQAILKGKKG